MKLIIVTLLLIAFIQSAPVADEVRALKGFYNFSSEFKMYSGYLTLQSSPLINIHYVFVTSKNVPEKDDVVLWLNGGPGCSSLLGN
jgi:carboxypeptidase C (cathepsin A)